MCKRAYAAVHRVRDISVLLPFAVQRKTFFVRTKSSASIREASTLQGIFRKRFPRGIAQNVVAYPRRILFHDHSRTTFWELSTLDGTKYGSTSSESLACIERARTEGCKSTARPHSENESFLGSFLRSIECQRVVIRRTKGLVSPTCCRPLFCRFRFPVPKIHCRRTGPFPFAKACKRNCCHSDKVRMKELEPKSRSKRSLSMAAAVSERSSPGKRIWKLSTKKTRTETRNNQIRSKISCSCASEGEIVVNEKRRIEQIGKGNGVIFRSFAERSL